MPSASPHTRGWTRGECAGHDAGAGFPAHAGMDPIPILFSGITTWLPRTRGDGPRLPAGHYAFAGASPHTRGWTRRSSCRARRPAGFPAHAGMDPPIRIVRPGRCRLPRTRGDGPFEPFVVFGPVPASPHTRGWTLMAKPVADIVGGFPAHAGMDPWLAWCPNTQKGLPRTRGDGPRRWKGRRSKCAASPHTRGWTPHGLGIRQGRPGFPAHAGMDPTDASLP